MNYRVTHEGGEAIFREASACTVSDRGVLVIRGQDSGTMGIFSADHWLRVEVLELDPLGEKRDTVFNSMGPTFNDVIEMSKMKDKLLAMSREEPAEIPTIKPVHLLFPRFNHRFDRVTLCGLSPIRWDRHYYACIADINCLACLQVAVADSHSLAALCDHGPHIKAVIEPLKEEKTT